MATVDRITKVQQTGGPGSCQKCHGTRKIVVKTEGGRKVQVDCPVCRASGQNVLVTK